MHDLLQAALHCCMALVLVCLPEPVAHGNGLQQLRTLGLNHGRHVSLARLLERRYLSCQ